MSGSRGRDKARVRSKAEAVTRLTHEYNLLSEDTGHDNPLHRDARHAIKTAFERVVQLHDLEDTKNELRAALLEATECYWTWWVDNFQQTAGLGEKESVVQLARELARVLKLLGEDKVRNRLDEAARLSESLAGPNAGPYFLFGECVFESANRSRAAVAGLLKAAQLAAKVDGRNSAGKKRDDIRAAARPLRDYWVKVAEKSGKLGQRGGIYSPTVRFLHDCLLLIDGSVTHRLIVDLDN